MAAITITRYDPGMKSDWDAFVGAAKNGSFLFQRSYMDYHSDRFHDYSLLFHKKDRLIAVLPANVNSDHRVLASHGGLSFGGVLSDRRITTPVMLELFEQLVDFLRANHVRKLLYKCIPYIFHTLPADEDRYALFRQNARMVRRDVSSAVYIPESMPFQERRRRRCNKARNAGVAVEESTNLEGFWPILSENLKRRHDKTPVHSVQEIVMLHNRFPEHIRLFTAFTGCEMLAGSVVFMNAQTAHLQYIACSDKGRDVGALDLLFEHLIHNVFSDKKYINFGVSTEQEGRYLNTGLAEFKEGFGARAIVYDFYELNV